MTKQTLGKGCGLCDSTADGYESHLEKVKAEARDGKRKKLNWDMSEICSSCRATLLGYGVSINHQIPSR